MSEGRGNFTKINETFDCVKCGLKVPPARKTCRNHCPKCLHSLHVDVKPGDRANSCKGVLVPISYDQRPNKGLSILFECERCHEKVWNVALTDDPDFSDDFDQIMKLSGAYKV